MSMSDKKHVIDQAKKMCDIINNDNYTSTNYVKSNKKIKDKDIVLFKIDTITYDKRAPRHEALENVFASVCISGINLIYIIEGDGHEVKIYFGVVKDFSSTKKSDIEIENIGKYILLPNLRGNFRGSKISFVDDKQQILKKINSDQSKICLMEGVPGYSKDQDKEAFQGVDRLIDVMIDENFIFLVIAKPIVENVDKSNIKHNILNFYQNFSPLPKDGRQYSESSGEQTTASKSESTSETSGKSNSTQHTNSSSDTNGTTEGNSSRGTSNSHTGGESSSQTDQISSSNQTGTTTTNGETRSKGYNETSSIEIINKNAQEWLEYIDEILLPRFDFGNGKGLYTVIMGLIAPNESIIIKLQQTVKAVFSGEEGNRIPLISLNCSNESNEAIKNFQLPIYRIENDISYVQMCETVKSKMWTCVRDKVSSNTKAILGGNWMTSRELSVLAGIPQKEVLGLKLAEEVEFGLNMRNSGNTNTINIGNIVQSGNETKNKVLLPVEYLDGHIFVTGVTGSGKTTTCKKLLMESRRPFLVIEPAKTEYRSLCKKEEELIVFTLGDENVAPFRLNPFELSPNENITSRVDMIKAAIEAAFDMEAAIPQIIEAAIYKSYDDKGWDIYTNQNKYYSNPYEEGIFAFPTLSDMVRNCDEVVKTMKFDSRLENDYIGSIRARLNGLLLGAKGAMLDSPRSVNFEELLDKRVVIELEEIRSGSEKSLIIGFILMNLLVAIKNRYSKNGKVNHITLFEEAHRLLSKFEPGDSLNKKHAIDTFTDMLAEIRKYGEALIIADQIPNKMTSEVLKNTNTKIVHRIFAQDDKDAIGSTMSLTKDQSNFLSKLSVGRCVIFNGDWENAIQVQITPAASSDSDVTNEDIQGIALKYYAEKYKYGIIYGSHCCDHKPSVEEVIEIRNKIRILKNELRKLKSFKGKTENLKIDDVTNIRDMLRGSNEQIKICILGNKIIEYSELIIALENGSENENEIKKLFNKAIN